MIRFELRKLTKRKLPIWLLAGILLVTSLFYIQNHQDQLDMKEEAFLVTDSYRNSLASETEQLKEVLEAGGSPEILEQQEALKGVSDALYSWRDVIYKGEWEDYPKHELAFAEAVQAYLKTGGQFNSLNGQELEIANAKASWMDSHQVSYKEEKNALSPHLFLKEISPIFFGPLGLFILLTLFGSIDVSERENQTRKLIMTQPVSRSRVVLSKFVALSMVIIFYIAAVVGLGLLIPLVAGGGGVEWQYPVILIEGQGFEVISFATWLGRGLLLFASGAVLLFSLSLAVGSRFIRSFSAMSLILLLGFLAYVLAGMMPTPFSPVRVLAWSEIVKTIPGTSDWIAMVVSILFAVVLLMVAVWVPENRTEGRSISLQRFAKGNPKQTKSSFQKAFHFETRKVLRQGLYRQVLLLLFLAVLIGYYLLHETAEQKRDKFFEQSVEEAEMIRIHSNQLLETVKKNEEMQRELGDEEPIVYTHQAEDMKQTARMMDVQADVALDLSIAYEEKDWRRFHANQFFLVYSGHKMSIGSFYNPDGPVKGMGVGQFNVEASLIEKEWMIEDSIEPVLPGRLVVSMYDSWGDNERLRQEWIEENQKVDSGGLFSVYHLLSSALYLLPILLLFFLFGSGFASERGKRRSLDFLLTEPLPTRSIFIGKVANAILLSAGTLFGLYGLVVLLGSVFKGFGDWMYPILQYVPDQLASSPEYQGLKAAGHGFAFMPLGEYVVQSVVLSILSLMFMIILGIFLSIFIRNKSVVFVALVLSVGGLYMLRAFWTAGAAYLPFTYLDAGNIADSTLATQLDNPAITFGMGVIVLTVSLLVLIVGGYTILRSGYRLR